MYKSALVALAVASLLSGTAFAQTAASSYTTGYRYDAMRRLTGVIKPDPDGTGALKFAAERYTYDADGVLLKKEIGELAAWQSQAVTPASWTGFTLLQSVEYAYDAAGRKLSERVKGANDTTYSLTQFSYDAAGRLSCTALRMNEGAFPTPPSDACALGTSGSQGADRISKNIYDAAGQVVQLRQAVGTALEQSYATYSFTPNGKREYVVDANGNKSKFEYDGFDRQKKWIFPSSSKPAAFNPASPAAALASAGAINTADYEEYGYDANGNRISLRKRDTSVLSYQYDALNRMTLKTVPERAGLPSTHTRDVYYSYSLTGSQTSARFDDTAGAGIISTYDGFGRVATESNTLIGTSPVLGYQYDRNGNRIRITHNGSQSFDMTFDGLNRLKEVKKGTTILASASYTNRGGVAAIDRYNAALDQGFTYDPVGRLQSLSLQQGTNSSNASWTFTRNAASQIRTEVRTNDAYAWDERVNANTAYVANGLNQYSQIGSVEFCYDANGNLTADGENAYLYDIENRLVEMRMRISTAACPTAQSGYGGSLLGALQYDPMGRLHEAKSYSNDALTGVTRFVYDGNALVMAYDGNDALIDRYIHGSDGEADDPLIWYAGSGTADNAIRNLYPDVRGSIVLVGDQGGAALGINTYDEWGAPDPDNLGRFQYTGQVWLPEVGMYYYKARIYSPRLGRLLQVDPVGYDDQINLYAYVANDPVNRSDPTGMESYMVARQLDSAVGKAGFGHAYIVVDAKYPGDPNAKVISFGELANGNMGNVNDPSRASDFSKTTHASDSAHWGSLGKDDTGSFSRIDAKDSTVSAVAGAVRETGDYDIVPGPDLFGGAPAVNSNSAAMGVAQRSTEISGGDSAKPPTDYALPGVNEAGRVQFDQNKICASDGIVCK